MCGRDAVAGATYQMVDKQASACENTSFANEKEAPHGAGWKGTETTGPTTMTMSVGPFSRV